MSAWEDYTYPGTQVLKNKAGIREQGDLQRFERGVTAVRLQELREKPVRGDYGLDHMRDIHRQVFRDVYEWAGEIRTVDIAKGHAGDRTVFALTGDIPPKAESIRLAIEEVNYLRGMDRKEFAAKMGEVYGAVNNLHPFREGNGRTAREYMEGLARESQHTLDYGRVDKQRWNEAAKQSSRGNLAPITEVFYEIAVVERAVAFDRSQGREGQREALAKHPELDGSFKRLHDSQRSGEDVALARAEISRELHEGKVVVGNVTVEESGRVIDNAAAYRGLMVRSADQLGGQFRGEVVAISSHHAMLKVGDMVAVRYERSNLDQEVHVGDAVAVHYGKEQSRVYARGQEPQRERGYDAAQLEREHTLASS